MSNSHIQAFNEFVKQAVAPVAASASRKRIMQEELLAHLSGIYEQEYARTNKAESSADRAMQRIGNANVLRRELQASVPFFERLTYSCLHIFNPFTFSPRGTMKRQIIIQLVTLLLACPILCISIWASWETPQLLNPFHNGFFPNLWILVLPALLSSMGIVASSLIGIRIASRQRVN